MSEQLVNDPERLKPENDPHRKNYEVEGIWHALMDDDKRKDDSWDAGFECISIAALRKYWHKATGWMPPE